MRGNKSLHRLNKEAEIRHWVRLISEYYYSGTLPRLQALTMIKFRCKCNTVKAEEYLIRGDY